MISHYPFITRTIALITMAVCVVISLDNTAHAKKPEKLFNATPYTLENGLKIIVVPNKRAPVITHMVWYHVGAADEPKGKSGIAHFLEHLMFKGSFGFEPGEFSKTIRALGGNDNAFTSQDYTAYFQSIAAQHLELVMLMEAGRMRGMNPPMDEFLSERDVILEERKQRIDNNPQAQFSQPIDWALYPNHPYGIPVIGWAEEIAKLEWDDAKRFYDHYYGPNNATLIVTGDVEPKNVLKLAKEIYGTISPVDIKDRNRPAPLPLMADNHIEMSHPAIQQPIIRLSLRAPSFKQDKKTSLALQVLENIMGGGSTSRLYKTLVIDQKIASQASMYYNASAIDDGDIQIYVTPRPDQNLDEVKAAAIKIVQDMLKNGLSDDEVSDAKTRLQNDALYALDSLSGPAMIIGRAVTTGSVLDDIEYWPHNISKVTKADIEQAAQAYMDFDQVHMISGYLLPAEKQTEETEQGAP